MHWIAPSKKDTTAASLVTATHLLDATLQNLLEGEK